MAWKKNANGVYERSCRHCGGTGKESLAFADWSACQCLNHVTLVEHPANGQNTMMSWQVMRCDQCGSFWLVYHDISDDSWDVPEPVRIGTRVPDEEWRREMLDGGKS